MPKLNPISPNKLVKIILGLWFSEIRVRWSHHFFRNQEWKTTVIPIHSDEEISVGLLKKILRDICLSVEELEKLR